MIKAKVSTHWRIELWKRRVWTAAHEHSRDFRVSWSVRAPANFGANAIMRIRQILLVSVRLATTKEACLQTFARILDNKYSYYSIG